MAKPRKAYRTDHISCPLNAGKKKVVDGFLKAWKHAVAVEARAAWREWAEHGAFRSTVVTAAEPAVACHAILGTSFGQMCMAQTRDVLRGWVAGLQDRARSIICDSSLDPDTRHQLHSLNVQQAWGADRSRTFTYGGKDNPRPVSAQSHSIFKSIIRHLLRHTRRPRLDRLWPKIDQRMARLMPASNASSFDAWLRLSTLQSGKPIELPLRLNSHFNERMALAAAAPKATKSPGNPGKPKNASTLTGETPGPGKPQQARTRKRKQPVLPPGWCHLAKTVQILPQPDGSLRIGLFTDMKPAFAQTSQAYVPRTDVLALDLGLANLFATDRGDLLGRCWAQQLARIDRVVTGIASARQRAGLKVHSRRYDRHVQRLRGLVKTQINRILNRLVVTHGPARLILENVDFRGGGLSRRLNRLLSLVGRQVLRTKLADLEQRYGIVAEFHESAYTSQECSSCGYVDARNRKTQARFQCRFCQHKCHADVNSARVIRFGRSEAQGSSVASRRRVLLERVSLFQERYPNPRSKPPAGRESRPSGRPCDPRWLNPYFAKAGEGLRGGISIG